MITATRTALSRIDAASWRVVSDNGENYVDAGVYPTKSGVFVYLNRDGTTRRELRPRSEVEKAISLATLQQKAVTNSHPPVLLDSTNTHLYAVGHVYGEHVVSTDGLHTQCRVRITNDRAIADINQGKQQVSCGYTCDLEETPGVDPEFGPYDAIQRNIRYNHLAIEWQGRAGPGARLTADSLTILPAGQYVSRFDAEEIPADHPAAGGNVTTPQSPPAPRNDSPERKPSPMSDVFYRLDGRDLLVSKETASALADVKEKTKSLIETQANRADAAETELATTKAQLAAKETELSTEKARADAAESELTKLREDQASAGRKALEAEAKAVLGSEVKLDGKSDREVKVEIVCEALDWDRVKLDGKDDAYIDTLLEVARKKSLTGTSRTVLDAYDEAEDEDERDEAPSRERKDGKDITDPEVARQARKDRMENGWKKKKESK